MVKIHIAIMLLKNYTVYYVLRTDDFIMLLKSQPDCLIKIPGESYDLTAVPDTIPRYVAQGMQTGSLFPPAHRADGGL